MLEKKPWLLRPEDAGLIADDARIVAYARAEKVFPGEDLNALRSPGAYIEIRRLNP